MLNYVTLRLQLKVFSLADIMCSNYNYYHCYFANSPNNFAEKGTLLGLDPIGVLLLSASNGEISLTGIVTPE